MLISSPKAPTDTTTAGDTSSVVILYNGAVSSSSPVDLASVSQPARKWDGATRRASLEEGTLTTKIEDGADELAKSQIAGSATLGDEDFVCFVDGSSTFQFREGLLGLRSTNCKADFWCASVEVGK